MDTARDAEVSTNPCVEYYLSRLRDIQEELATHLSNAQAIHKVDINHHCH